MTATTTAAVDRRQFLTGATAVAAMAVSGTAVIHTTEAWGLEAGGLKPTTMRTLVKMARDIYPHDRVADRFYAAACKPYAEKSKTDAALRDMIEAGVKNLNALSGEKHGQEYAAVGWEKTRVALLTAVQASPLFSKLRGDLVVSLYNQKDLWPLFGYEGESAIHGGYINRGFNDIAWL
ncbi:MAG: twin-arginine translocation signal domain-containing protein [Hyphomicrobiales bacterium]|nr:twin-arginine translocation signal domain-containing protein [Hyphomicrobiales bacterium]